MGKASHSVSGFQTRSSNQKGCQVSKQNLCAAVTVKMLQEDAKHKPVFCVKEGREKDGGESGRRGCAGARLPDKGGDHLLVTTCQCPLCATSRLYPEFLLFSLGLFAWIKLDTKEQKLRLEALNRQLVALNMENEEVDYLLNEADEAQLYERLARERGYVYADEKVYYNVTPGN